MLRPIPWNNALDRNRRDFSLESIALESAVFGNVRAAQNALENVAAFLVVKPDLDQSEFMAIVHELLDQHPYLHGVIYCPAVSGAQPDCRNGPHVARDDSGEERFRTGSPVADNPQLGTLIARYLDVAAAVAKPGGAARELWLFKPIGAQPAPAEDMPVIHFGGGLVAVVLDIGQLPGNSALASSLVITLSSDLAGLGGREVLLSRPQERKPGQWGVTELVREGALQFPLYSMHLRISRTVAWQEVDRETVYTALLIGIGVTLLLVALVRARDLQARVLRERNIVIEQQVEEQTKELALARDQALDASRVKSEFLASMSHEIRTPLNAIIGMAELLSETPLTGEQKKYIDVFRKAGDTLLSLVNDILDLSKIEARQLDLEDIAFDLYETVEESVDIYALKAAAKDIELVCCIDPRLEPTRRGDPARLRQIILNLISNALKFTDRGEIVVHVAAGADGRLEFAVNDTGIGIPADKLEAIFASFTQVDSSITRRYGGTGLGLTISRSLVDMMGGRIWVESELGRGSAFRFSVRLPPVADGRRRRLELPHLDGLRILAIDDNASSLENVSVHLRRAGAAVTGVSGPEAALQALEGGATFDLIIADCRMPARGGFDLVADFRQRGIRTRTLMMLSATDLKQHMSQLKSLGVSAYLLKPVKAAELLNQVRDVLGGQQVEQAAASPAAGEETLTRPLRILLVEDNPDNRLLVRSYLKKLPWEIDEAENGQIAVDKFSSGTYDLVLMDVQMPVMDGHLATRTIRQWEGRNGRAPTPIIALTAHAIKEEIDKCIASGCNACLSKPVKKAVLVEAIQAAASGRSGA
ncbi:MAG: response regulator [Gammaproteobacteria bacterium]|nr:response regulator [Gammaproteobacteria bacterium]